MDIATIIGLVAAFALMLMAMVTGDFGWTAAGWFVDKQSILITFGGTLFAVLASNTVPDFIAGLKSITLVFKVPS
ncbi:MAG: motility protein A, partial [Lachnospiraceae bacterium]|nr:motility protein A [Lachnospiraceae bacterium]